MTVRTTIFLAAALVSLSAVPATQAEAQGVHAIRWNNDDERWNNQYREQERHRAWQARQRAIRHERWRMQHRYDGYYGAPPGIYQPPGYYQRPGASLNFNFPFY